MYSQIPILADPYGAAKINIIEGPDGVGKSTLIKSIRKFYEGNDIDLRVLRFPDNYENVPFRRVIMTDEVAMTKSCQAFLFLSDMLYSFENFIQPHLKDPNVIFLLDRFMPTTCIYQKIPIPVINRLFSELYPDFTEAFSHAHYHYLAPRNFDEIKQRLAQKHGDDRNNFDPDGDEALREQIRAYWNFCIDHKNIGLLGSFRASTLVI